MPMTSVCRMWKRQKAVVVVAVGVGVIIFLLAFQPKSARRSKQKTASGQGPGLPAFLRVIRSSALPDVKPGSRLLRVSGQKWMRYGRPWREQVFRHVRLVLYCVPGPRAQLLLYAQSLDGVFNEKEKQYLAVWVTTSGRLVGKLLLKGQSEAQTNTLLGDYCNGQPQVVTVSVTAELQVRISARPALPFDPASADPDLNKLGRYEYGETQPSDGKAANGIALDSGLYLGAVQDRKYITAAGSLPDFDNLDGVLYEKVSVNGRLVDLVQGDQVQRGIVNEYIARYLQEDLKLDLSKPVTASTKMHDMDEADIATQRFPVINAVSDNHVDEIVGMIATVQKAMPLRGVIVYDVGLNQKNRELIRGLCNATVRAYRSDLHAALIGNLWEYRFKPLLIHSGLDEFGGVIYADSSIRFQQSVTNIPMLRHGYGVVTFGPLGTSPVSAFTHDTMLAYFGVSRLDVTNATIAIGGINIWLDRPLSKEVVLWQWFRCVLDPKCICPHGAIVSPCNFELGKIPGKYIGCHRFDQSAISVILLKTFHDRFGKGTIVTHPDDLKYVTIEREKSIGLTPCKTHT